MTDPHAAGGALWELERPAVTGYGWSMQPDQGEVALESLQRIEQSLTDLVRRLQRVRLHTDGPVQLLERSAYTILGLLSDEGPMRNGALAARLHLDASTVSRHVAALQQSGLIAREPDAQDGRACRLRLTSAGQRAVEGTRQARRSAVRELIGLWPVDEQDLFASLLERLSTGLAGRSIGSAPAPSGADPHRSVAIPDEARSKEVLRA